MMMRLILASALSTAVLVSSLHDARAGADVNGIDVNGIDVNGIDVNGVDVNGIDVNGVDVNGVDVNGIDVNGSNLNGQSLNGTDGHKEHGKTISLHALGIILSDQSK